MWPRKEATRLREAAQTVRVAALFARARAAATASPPDYKACAANYLASLEPNFGQVLDVALYEAAECLDADGDAAGARRARQTLLRRTPHSRFADEVRALLGQPSGD